MRLNVKWYISDYAYQCDCLNGTPTSIRAQGQTLANKLKKEGFTLLAYSFLHDYIPWTQYTSTTYGD